MLQVKITKQPSQRYQELNLQVAMATFIFMHRDNRRCMLERGKDSELPDSFLLAWKLAAQQYSEQN
jgi:hypothetical protein